MLMDIKSTGKVNTHTIFSAALLHDISEKRTWNLMPINWSHDSGWNMRESKDVWWFEMNELQWRNSYMKWMKFMCSVLLTIWMWNSRPPEWPLHKTSLTTEQSIEQWTFQQTNHHIAAFFVLIYRFVKSSQIKSSTWFD